METPTPSEACGIQMISSEGTQTTSSKRPVDNDNGVACLNLCGNVRFRNGRGLCHPCFKAVMATMTDDEAVAKGLIFPKRRGWRRPFVIKPK